MKNYKIVLALDPSGSYTEGKGTTGWCLFNTESKRILDTGDITASSYQTMEAYWDAHIQLIQNYIKLHTTDLVIVIEDYLLYAHKSDSQVNSRMETSKLIGILQHYCWFRDIPYKMQLASEVKTRWTDSILEYKKYIQKKGNRYINPSTARYIHKHCRDAIRHAVHYTTFKNKN